MTDTIEAPIAGPGIAPQDHNKPPVSEMLKEKPDLLFTDSEMAPMLFAAIEAEIAAHKPDLETEKGRAAIKSLAYSIATRKTAYDEAGAKLVEHHRAEVKRMDVLRKTIKDRLTALQALARKPFDDWQAAEDQRRERINRARELYRIAAIVSVDATLASIANTRKMVEDTPVDDTLFGGFAKDALVERQKALDALDAGSERIRVAEAQAAELARLQAAERERQAQEAAAERARQAEAARAARELELAEAADRAAKEAEERAREESRKAAERALADAEEKRRQEQIARDNAAAEADRQRQAEQRRKDEEAAAALRAERERAAKAEREAAALRRAEEARQAEKAKADAEAARLAKNKANRQRCAKEAREAIQRVVPLDDEQAVTLLRAIVAGEIPHVSMSFTAPVETVGK